MHRPANRRPLPALSLATALMAPALMVSAALVLACGDASNTVAPEGAAAGTVTVTAAADRSTATVGDAVRYTVEVRHPEGMSPILLAPVVDGAVGGLRVVDAGVERPRRPRGVALARHWWILRAERTGSYVLPAASVTVEASEEGERRIESNEVFVDVVSILPEDAADIRDVKPPRRSAGWMRWLWIGAAALALAVALFAWWWWRRRQREAQQAPALLPHELALRELDRLRRTDFSSLAELRRYYFEISEVLRRYVEARFGLNATDLTTEEIFARLGELRDLAGMQSTSLREFLVATDRVKYAAMVPTEPEIEQTYELALSFVESTRQGVDSAARAEGGVPMEPGDPPGAGAGKPAEQEEAPPASPRRAVG
ncbi:MAG TPA: DUF4381 family protein [Thermoanaerobaculia bacterium]|nr:DUF4381 family protein [Thermoanaerobaculia bacterium]